MLENALSGSALAQGLLLRNILIARARLRLVVGLRSGREEIKACTFPAVSSVRVVMRFSSPHSIKGLSIYPHHLWESWVNAFSLQARYSSTASAIFIHTSKTSEICCFG